MPIGGGDNEEKPIPRGTYNLDALGDDAFGGPPPSNVKKAPPKLANKKIQEEEKGGEDSRPKPKVEEKKKAAAAPATAGGPKTPNIQEEDVGAGLSKEEAEAKVAETFSPEALELLGDDKKWNEKVEGFKLIAQDIANNKPESIILEAVVRFTKSRLKDWKESNINLIKEAINLFTTIASATENLNKRSAFVMMPFLSDKLGDVKTLALTSELLVTLSESVTPKYIALQLIKYGT